MYSLLFLLAASFGLSLVLTPIARALFFRLNIVDVPDELRRFHARPVARAGGVAVVPSFVLAYALLLALPFGGKVIVASHMQLILRLLPAVIMVFGTGLADDVLGLKPWQKLLGQTSAAGLACWAGLRVNGIEGHAISNAAVIPITILWLLACTNAVNLLDGIDGLACGIGLFASLTTILAAALTHNVPLAMAAIPLAGSLCAFLIYNFHPASIFLGDSGSLFIGFLLGCYGLIWSQKSATLMGMTAPLMLLTIPLLDTSLSIARRFLRHKPIMQADRGHLHHRLLENGFSIRGAVLALYAVFSFAALFSLVQSVVQKQYNGLVIVVFCLCFSFVVWVGLERLGYIEVQLASRMLYYGTFSRRMLHTQLSVWELERAVSAAPSFDSCWLAISRAAADLGFCSVSLKLNGNLYEAEDAQPPQSDCWELCIPLSGADYIQLGRAYDSHTQEFVLTIFVGVLRDVMRAKIREFGSSPISTNGEQAAISPQEAASAAV